MLKRLLAVLVLTFGSQACVTTLSQQDLESIKSVQVLTSIEDKFFITDMGLTVFENDFYEGTIADWKLRQRMLDRLQSALPAGARVVDVKDIAVDTEIYEGMNSLATKFKTDAISKGADTILVLTRSGIYNAANGGSWTVNPRRGGFGFFSKSLFGKPVLTCPFLSYQLALYRVVDGKLLTYSSETICINQNEVEQVLEYSKYPPQAKDFFRKTLEKSIDENFQEKVKSLFKVRPANGSKK